MPASPHRLLAQDQGAGPPVAIAPPGSLAAARRGFTTNIVRKRTEQYSATAPPKGILDLVRYPAPVGKLAAYITAAPASGGRHPAIIWLVGGFSNGIDETAWEPAKPDNDQSASVFRQAGIVTMYPSLRGGGGGNPGVKEYFFGEVDNVLAAADYLAKQPYVDASRIYLGGHSTGGTLALLVAESSDRFRAVFSFGPVAKILRYGLKEVPFDFTSKQELALRSPGDWLSSISTPTFVFEGTQSPGNIDDLKEMNAASTNPKIHFYPVERGNHFSTLAPVSRLVSQRILADTGPAVNIGFDNKELTASVILAAGSAPPPTTAPAGKLTILELGNGVTMKLAVIPAGTFTMGSPADEGGHQANEPQHTLVIPRAFWMGVTEVTQAQWKSVIGTEPSYFKGDDLPVEQVSWNDAVEFCHRLSDRTKRTVRVPTEAEWEYACRAGTTGPFGGTGKLDDMGWYIAQQPHAVAQKKPNAWGLYDMHGNVTEWCSEGSDPDQKSRILRGGSWVSLPRQCRSAYRVRVDPGLLNHCIGFRVVLDVP